jgi:hypothetical protein
MTMPKAYCPEYGYKYQILCWDSYNREYDHIDYAKDKEEKNYLLAEYIMVGGIYKSIPLPKKYWA